MHTAGHRFRVSDIAAQARLSRATVDRVLHGRSGVRPETISQVGHAIAELDRQRSEILLSRMPAIFDLVIQSCADFGAASQAALECQIRSLHASGVRARSHVETSGDALAVVAMLDQIGKRGSHGVILKAAENIDVNLAVNRLAKAGIPTVTYVTDLPDSCRVGHVGPDHRAAGQTAAYLVSQWSPATSKVLLSLTTPYLSGQAHRRQGFLEALNALQPTRGICEHLADLAEVATADSIAETLAANPEVDVIYASNGHCGPALAAFARLKRTPRTVIAHELTTSNRSLLRDRQISAILHYDVHADLQKACVMLLQERGMLPGAQTYPLSQTQIITPYNLPPE